MNNVPDAGRKGRWLAAFSYLLSAVSGALGLLNWLALRETMTTLVAHSTISRWSWRAIDQFGFLLLGMLWLSFTLFVQHFYVKGAESGKLWSRVSAITGIQLILLFACHLIPLLAGALRYSFQWAAIAGAEGVAGAGLLWLGILLAGKK